MDSAFGAVEARLASTRCPKLAVRMQTNARCMLASVPGASEAGLAPEEHHECDGHLFSFLK